MRSVVVTGLAGTLGHRLAPRLAASGLVVTGVDLPGAPLPGGYGAVELDLAREGRGPDEALRAALAGVDTVVHLAWRIPEGRRQRRAQRVNGANLAALDAVLAAAAACGVRQVVFVSSATVYGAWPDNPVPITEDAPLRPNPGFAFASGKAEAERSVAEWGETHPGAVLTVLRPAVTVGGAAEQPLYRALGATRGPQGDDGGRLVQFLHVDDLAEAVRLVVEQRRGGVFNVAADGGVREEGARALAGGVARLALPTRLARAVAASGWELIRRGVPREALAYSTQPWVVAADRLRAAGWKPGYTSEEALVATDERAHWDDLPPGRRQNYTLLAAVSATLTGLGGLVAGFLAWRRRPPR